MNQKDAPTQKRQVMLYFCALLFGLLTFTGKTYAQAISITWNSETGCLVYDDKREKYTEEIEDGPCVRVCEQSTVTYSLTGNSTSWVSSDWNVAGGTIVSTSLTECVVNWGNAGWGSVSVAVTKDDETVHEEEICVEVIISPTALFGLMPDTSSNFAETCLKDILQFVNLSQTNGGTGLIAYHWDFGDNTTSSEFEPTHQYSNPGPYTVTLTVTNACNCTDTYEMHLKVREGGFEIACASVVCDGEQATYSVPEEIVEACGGHNNWSVVGGTIASQQPYGQSIEVNWDNVGPDGFGYVTYDASQCNLECPGTVTIQIPVIQAEGTIEGENVVCVNEQNIYKLPQWPSTVFNWTLNNNGVNAVLVESQNANEVILQTYNSSGQITLNVTYHNTLLNCSGVATLDINIRPRAIIDGNFNLCNFSTGNYQIQGGYSGNWELSGPNGVTTGSGNTFSHNFTVAGNYDLTVNGNNFCKPAQLTIVVRDQEEAPNAIIGPDESCPDVPVTYSVVNNITGTQIGWDVVGGSIDGNDYGDEVSITFSGAGPYIVKAWRENVTEPNCVSDTITKTVTLPVLDMEVTGDEIVCSSTYGYYQIDYNDGETYSWSISPATAGSVSSGNGTTDIEVLWNEYSGSNPVYVVASVTKCGIVQPGVVLPVQIITSPTVSLGSLPNQICQGDPLTLNLTSIPTLTSGTITWDFGDGTTIVTDESMPNWLTATHTYTGGGSQINYDIQVTVAGANGCINDAVANDQIEVLPSPVASISPAGVYAICPNMSPQVLTVNIQGGLSGVTNIEWFKTTSATPVLSGATASSYTATVYGSYYAIVTGTNGCTTTTNIVVFNGNCTDPPPCTTNETVTITSAVNNCGTITVNATYTGNPSGIQWVTNTPPVSQSTSNNTGQFTFDESGSYTIFYKVTYGNCIVTRSTSVIVSYMPDLKYTITCGPNNNYEVTLLDNSNHYPNHNITSHIFSADGTNYPQGALTSKTVYLSPGVHTLGLTIDGPNSTPCSVSPLTIDLPTLPVATFTHNGPRCQDAVFDFVADDTQSGLSYLWEFGDSSSNRQQNPEKVYENPSTYNVKLTVTNQYGCSAEYDENVTVTTNTLDGEVTASSETACDGTAITLTYNNLGLTPQTYHWMNGSNEIGTTTHPNNSFDVTTSGTYWVSVESANGCVKDFNESNDKVTVTFIIPPTANISGQDEVCVGKYFTLTTAAGSNDVDYTWTLNGNPLNQFNGENTINQTLNTVGTYVYEVTVSIPDGNGGFCTDTDTHTVVVNPLPAIPQIHIINVDCETYTFTLEATAPGNGTFTWSNGDTGAVIDVTQGGAIQVRYTNTSGCSTTRTIVLPKDPAVHLWTVPTGCYSICKELLNLSSLTGPSSAMSFPYWEWLQNNNVKDFGTNSPVTPLDLGPLGNGVYQLLLDNGYCKRVSDEVNIDLTECPHCRMEVKVKDVKVDKDHGFCLYRIYLDINNPYGYPVQLTLTELNGFGVFQPTSITVNPGNGLYFVDMIPINGYTGGTVSIIFEGTVEGKPCIMDLKFELPECGREKKLTETAGANEKQGTSLLLSPNPAEYDVQLQYDFGNSVEGDSRRLEVYSLMGVLMESHEPKDVKGTWSSNLARFSAGQYIVVMKLNGTVLSQQALIVK